MLFQIFAFIVFGGILPTFIGWNIAQHIWKVRNRKLLQRIRKIDEMAYPITIIPEQPKVAIRRQINSDTRYSGLSPWLRDYFQNRLPSQIPMCWDYDGNTYYDSPTPEYYYKGDNKIAQLATDCYLTDGTPTWVYKVV